MPKEARNPNDDPREIVVTIPKTLARESVFEQLEVHCAKPGVAWHYMVTNAPKARLSRMHFVHDGELIGSLPITGVERNDRTLHLRRADDSRLTTSRPWAILAHGAFVPQDPPVPWPGFRGWRYFDHTCPECGGLGDVVLSPRQESCPCRVCLGKGRI